MRFIFIRFHQLSLDVVLGSVGSFAFACWTFHLKTPAPVAIILAVTVWIIYLADHVLDSSSLSIVQPRKYSVFKRNKKKIITGIILLMITDILLIAKFLPVKYIFAGAMVGIFLCLYLLLQHKISRYVRKYFPKELLISFIYTLAIWFYPLLQAHDISAAGMMLMGIHFLLVLTNVMLFSYFDRSEDILNLRLSAFTGFSDTKYRTVILFLIAVTFGCCIILVSAFHLFRPVWVLIMIGLVYLLEIVYRRQSLIKYHYPEITDGAFLPFLVFLFASL